MDLPERFQIDITEPVETCCYRRPCTATVSYYNPYQIMYSGHCCGNNTVLSETAAIRHELSELRNDIGDLRRQQYSYTPSYYVAKQDNNSNSSCSECISSANANQYPTYAEERPYTAGRMSSSKAPITTYQDHYRGPDHYGYTTSRPQRRATMNEMQSQAASSSTVQHPRNWVPGGHKNSYPNRRWNLSVPHPEP
ncbi:hypothetical protein I4U23_023384 [Adineta vaga]|nr:hypothetical protein I4U23_023384 [Adineta vaga]